MTIVDADQRLTAIDPLRSFCVSAPAGSGKTELLIQRYLILLGRVRKPEQVLAITFTRKAAAEMRERVLQALVEARDDQPCESEHQKLTRKLALAALAADERETWQLISNISRLNIKTIDSYCGQLTRQMPVLSGFGGQAEVVEAASELYAQAVSELFKLIESQHELASDLAALMLHFDNDWAKLQELLVSMLARRDQWREYIGVHHEAEEAESYLLHTVEGIVTDELTELNRRLAPHRDTLLRLQQYAASNLESPVPMKFPSPQADELGAWRDLRKLLLTAGKSGNWRAKVDKRMGFPAGKGLAQERKTELAEVIAQLRGIDGLLDDLRAISFLPEISSGSQSWQFVLHLSRVLPRLAAELLLVFQRQGKVDHSQVSLAALQALGDDDDPTELAMRLDYQLEHILVDEFQDTAINQYELVRRLTRGWGEHNEQNPDNPRTLFIVGDGMQSIYGFRDANVGLFLRARQEGFNGVALRPVALRSNFRSGQGVVDWVNETFREAFPAEENVSRGQIRFTPATAVRPLANTPAISLRGFTGEGNAAAEIDAICTSVEAGLADADCGSIAILARTRGHLQGILASLKARGIKYSAQDIDSLADSSVIVDLLSLCRTLINPADRVAWMAVLRAPWCGLTLADLHVIANTGDSPELQSLSSVLTNEKLHSHLSADGYQRMSHLAAAMEQSWQNRDRLPLRVWVETLWFELGGPATVTSDAALQDAERFFQLLEHAELEGQGLSLAWLKARLERLYVQAENPDSKIQVMTLHKAKGLEFDWVFIPALEKTTRVNARPLMLWDDHSSASGQRGFLLAADDHSAEGDPTLYNWLKLQRANKEVLETTRLLYVGVTRAAQRLFLSACIKVDERKGGWVPPNRSLLGSIWSHFEQGMSVVDAEVDDSAGQEYAYPGLVRRLTDHSLQVVAPTGRRSGSKFDGKPPVGHIASPAFNRMERYVGTVVHLAMEQLSRLDTLPRQATPVQRQRWHTALANLGLHGEDLEEAASRVNASVAGVLSDKVGRWILSSAHPEAASELALKQAGDEKRADTVVIDRTFVDEETGQRWLIDYKNSRPFEGEALSEFTAREAENYTEQLSTYRDCLAGLYTEPVKCALYFTALAHLHPVTL